MHPERAARFLSILGIYVLVTALILRVISLSITTWQTRMGLESDVIQPIQPTLSQYQLSPDGKQVTFAQQIGTQGDPAWFQMPLEGGSFSPAQAPVTDLGPFDVRNEQVYIKRGDVFAELSGSSSVSHVTTYARSPDGNRLAFVAAEPGNGYGLYIVSTTDILNWLGDHKQIDEIAWSPDGHKLAFLAAVNGIDQVFTIQSDGQVQRQITDEPTSKNSLRWSHDGSIIAYIASTTSASHDWSHQAYKFIPPISNTPDRWSIHTVSVNGDKPRVLAEDDQLKFHLEWGDSGTKPVLVYSAPLPDKIKSSYLYALEPGTGQVHQVYPPLEITAMNCPSQIQTGQRGTVGIVIANSGLGQASVSLVLRASPKPYPVQGALDKNVVHLETLQVPSGANQTIELPVQAQPGLFTHLSTLINPNGLFAMDEQRCVIKNTYFGLPNLSYLNLMLPLLLIGMILCIPWLRNQKKTALWVLYLAIPMLTLVITYLELRLVEI
jgi:hypothetical protein